MLKLPNGKSTYKRECDRGCSRVRCGREREVRAELSLSLRERSRWHLCQPGKAYSRQSNLRFAEVREAGRQMSSCLLSVDGRIACSLGDHGEAQAPRSRDETQQ